MIATIFRSHTTVAVTVKAGHGLLREEGERLFEDCQREYTWSALTETSEVETCFLCDCTRCKARLREVREQLPFKLLLLGLVAMLKAAMRASRKSGSKKIKEVVKE